jgi:ABC-type transporter Mla subunit MlaD
MRGVNIGRVKRFMIQPNGTVGIDLEVEGEYKIPVDSQVKLSSAGPLGGMKADIIPGIAPTNAKYGDTLAGQTEKGLEEMTAQAGDVLTRVQKVLADDTIANGQRQHRRAARAAEGDERRGGGGSARSSCC